MKSGRSGADAALKIFEISPDKWRTQIGGVWQFFFQKNSEAVPRKAMRGNGAHKVRNKKQPRSVA